MQIHDKITDPVAQLEEYRRTGDIELRNALVMYYSYIPKAVAAQMRGITSSYAQLEDIVNQGIITLIDCVEKYSPDKGTKFETYAFMRVKGANIDFVRKQDWLPRRVRKAARDVSAAYDELSAQLLREPTTKEIAEHMGVPEAVINKHYSEISNSVMLSFESLLQSVTPGQESEIDEPVDAEAMPEGSLMQNELREQLTAAIDSLSEKERLVVSLYYYEHLKFCEIATVMQVSESRVCQVHSKAILKMKKRIEDYMKG